jgi:hypothetical protein
MQIFLNKVVSDVLSKHDNISDLNFILPNKRAGLFLKEEISSSIQNSSILPRIIGIEDLIQEISCLDTIESTTLIFEFYNVYLKHTKGKRIDSFELFSKWAAVLLQDFNEIDSNLIDANEVLNYITDSKRIENWDLNNKQSTLTENYLKFFDDIKIYYKNLYEHLTAKKIGYQGILYREAYKQIDSYLRANEEKKFIFVGFNALNKAEESIIQNILKTGSSEIFWDTDTFYFNQENEAGKFFRSYKKKWNYYQTNKFNWIEDNLNNAKNIYVKGVPKNITQIKEVGEILQNIHLKEKNLKNTAIVLCNEKLLPVLLNSIPKEIETANITMGYSLQNIPVSKLFHLIFKLHLNKSKFEKNDGYYYKDFISIIDHPLIHKTWVRNTNFKSELDRLLIKNKNIFISAADIKLLIKGNPRITEIFELIFIDWDQRVNYVLRRFLLIIECLKEDEESNYLEKEYFFRFNNVFQQLVSLNKEFGYLSNLNTLYIFYTQLLNFENLFFKGEPLQGLQIMGMLESRVLDFENVILTSANEGFLPSQGRGDSFIPFEIKIAKNLPSYREKDAIFAYHFYRLLHRSKNVYLLYNTVTDDFGSGEMSRFITQLDIAKQNYSLEKINLYKSIVIPKFNSYTIPLKEIRKSPQIMNRLNEISIEGFSPSSLSVYIRNPIDFYKQKILKLKEVKEVEETVAANTFGTIIHEAMDALYSPFIGSFITKADLFAMKSKLDSEIKDQFKKHYSLNSISTGKNYLTFQIAKQFLANFLNYEISELEKGNEIKILDLECKVAYNYEFDGLSFPIKLKGTIDRIDEVNGVLRILDYKTGKVTTRALKIDDWDLLSSDYAYSKTFQVLLYAFMYAKNNNINLVDQNVESGIISFKNLKAGFMKINNTSIGQYEVDQFLIQLNKLLIEIYNSEIPFKEKEILLNHA